MQMILACKQTCLFQTVILKIHKRLIKRCQIVKSYVCIFSSTEPGFYKNGEFGIRIEDIVQIVNAKIENDFNGRGALTFNTVTMCPIQTKLINANLLTEKEVTRIFFE